MYPASMTKIMTALVALDHLNPDEIVVTGSEVNLAPSGSSLAGHKPGEAILVINLMRGLLIPSGNESGIVVAKAVVKKSKGVEDVNYGEAEKIFAEMMNEKAKKLGANDTNFVNPYGGHDQNHYSTAFDMALIAKEAMKNPLIKQIVAEKSFEGNGAGENYSGDAKTQNYTWRTHNLLLSPTSEYLYEYATGIKTGFTDEAERCVTASAEKDNKKLISVVFYSPEPGRWLDSIKLFDYGFNFFDFETIQEKGVVLGEVPLSNSRLGESEILEYVSNDEFVDFLSKDELDRIKKTITFDENYITPAADDTVKTVLRLQAPIEKDAVIGKVTYTLDQKVLFEDSILAASEVLERTFKSDASYYFEIFKANAFSFKALPYWGIGITLIGIVIWFIIFLNNRQNRKYRRNLRRY